MIRGIPRPDSINMCSYGNTYIHLSTYPVRPMTVPTSSNFTLRMMVRCSVTRIHCTSYTQASSSSGRMTSKSMYPDPKLAASDRKSSWPVATGSILQSRNDHNAVRLVRETQVAETSQNTTTAKATYQTVRTSYSWRGKVGAARTLGALHYRGNIGMQREPGGAH